MSDNKFTDMLRKGKSLSEEELAALEVSEDKRLRESGIDPNADPIDIMMEVNRRAKALRAAEEKENKED